MIHEVKALRFRNGTVEGKIVVYSYERDFSAEPDDELEIGSYTFLTRYGATELPDKTGISLSVYGYKQPDLTAAQLSRKEEVLQRNYAEGFFVYIESDITPIVQVLYCEDELALLELLTKYSNVVIMSTLTHMVKTQRA